MRHALSLALTVSAITLCAAETVDGPLTVKRATNASQAQTGAIIKLATGNKLGQQHIVLDNYGEDFRVLSDGDWNRIPFRVNVKSGLTHIDDVRIARGQWVEPRFVKGSWAHNDAGARILLQGGRGLHHSGGGTPEVVLDAWQKRFRILRNDYQSVPFQIDLNSGMTEIDNLTADHLTLAKGDDHATGGRLRLAGSGHLGGKDVIVDNYGEDFRILSDRDWNTVPFRVNVKSGKTYANEFHAGHLRIWQQGGNEGGELTLAGTPEQADVRLDVYRSEFRILSGGQEHIRYDFDDRRLRVGNLRTGEVVVEAQWWADHVFADDYELWDLERVAAYIEVEGHLPAMPSSEEVLDCGLSLADITARQQQKIEELTLHAIAQRRSLEQRDRRIEALEARLEALERLQPGE